MWAAAGSQNQTNLASLCICLLQEFLFSFLLSSRLFMRPHELLGKLLDSVSDERSLEVFVALLSEWTQKFPYDYRDERMMNHVKHIVARWGGDSLPARMLNSIKTDCQFQVLRFAFRSHSLWSTKCLTKTIDWFRETRGRFACLPDQHGQGEFPLKSSGNWKTHSHIPVLSARCTPRLPNGYTIRTNPVQTGEEIG